MKLLKLTENNSEQSDNYRGWALDRVHNSRQPLDRLLHFFTCDLWSFDIIFIVGRVIMMDYPYAKFGDCTFSLFGFIVRSDRQTDSHTDACHRLTHATVVGVSREWKEKQYRSAADDREMFIYMFNVYHYCSSWDIMWKLLKGLDGVGGYLVVFPVHGKV